MEIHNYNRFTYSISKTLKEHSLYILAWILIWFIFFTIILDNFSGIAEDDLIEGRLNGGGKLVDLQASDGDVNLSFN